jgi:hypothetical protein
MNAGSCRWRVTNNPSIHALSELPRRFVSSGYFQDASIGPAVVIESCLLMLVVPANCRPAEAASIAFHSRIRVPAAQRDAWPPAPDRRGQGATHPTRPLPPKSQSAQAELPSQQSRRLGPPDHDEWQSRSSRLRGRADHRVPESPYQAYDDTRSLTP